MEKQDKQLMLGNEAIARGLYESGVSFVSSYPGTPSTEITEYSSKYPEIYAEWAPNEKVAMESAFGASLSGKRSFCGMKHVGLNVAADPLFTLSYTGINGGMVVCVADDPGMHSSQNEQDSRYYAMAAKLPMLEPSDSQDCLEFTKLAYKISEKYDTPVFIKTCTRVAHSQSVVNIKSRCAVKDKPYKKDPQKYVMVPAMAQKRHPIIEERLSKLEALAETCSINKIEEGYDNDFGIITSSTSYQYVKEVCANRYPILKLGMIYPMPKQKITTFANNVDKLIIVEELDGFIETYCRSIGCECEGKKYFSSLGELSQNKVAYGLNKIGCDLNIPTGVVFSDNLPNRSPTLCPGCPHRSMFYLFKKLHLNVLGDIGCYTLGMLPPMQAMDTAICMGASVSSSHGFNKLNEQNAHNTVAVIGDSTFVHSGITGLINIAYNQSNSTVVILDNSITGMTGHQQNPTTGLNIYNEPAGKICLEDLCHSIGIEHVRVVDPYDLKATEAVLKKELAANTSSVIISRCPCVLLKGVKLPGPINVDHDKCIGCKSCMKIGCPAISIDNKKAYIDQTLCVGCGVCLQMCKFNALPKQIQDNQSKLS